MVFAELNVCVQIGTATLGNMVRLAVCAPTLSLMVRVDRSSKQS